jgi:DinB superfamily
MSPIEEALTEFGKGPDMLEAALTGLSEAGLDQVSGNEGWTIREIIHHLAEADTRQTTFTRIALLSCGHTFEFSWHPGNKAMAAVLNYARLPVAPSLVLFRANREHFSRMLRGLLDNSPSVWDYYLIAKASPEEDGTRVTVGEWITGMTSHLQEHLVEINNIREGPGKQRANSILPSLHDGRGTEGEGA